MKVHQPNPRLEIPKHKKKKNFFSHSQELGPQEIQDVVTSTKTSSAMSASRQDSRVWVEETLRLLVDRIGIFLKSDSDLTILYGTTSSTNTVLEHGSPVTINTAFPCSCLHGTQRRVCCRRMRRLYTDANAVEKDVSL